MSKGKIASAAPASGAALSELSRKIVHTMMKKMRRDRMDELQKFISSEPVQVILRKRLAFFVDKNRENIQLKISTSEESYTNGKNIVIGIPDMFFQPQYKNEDWLIIAHALLGHEIQHINSSSFSDIKDIRKKFAKHMEGTVVPKDIAENLAQNMLNIMEDGRIENIVIHKYPGLVMNFRLLNGEIRLYNTIYGPPADPSVELSDFIGNILSYVKTGMFAPGVEVYKDTQFEFEFRKIQPLLDLSIDARNSRRCKELCYRVLTAISSYLEDLLKEKKAQDEARKQFSQDGNGQGGEYTSDSENEYNESPNGTPKEQKECNEEAKKKAAGSNSSKQDKKDYSKDGGKPGDGKEGQDGADSKGDASGKKTGGSDGGGDSADGKGEKPQKDNGNSTGKNMLRRPNAEDRSDIEHWVDDFSGDGAEDYEKQELTEEQLEALRRGIRDELQDAAKPEKKERKDSAMEAIEKRYQNEYTRTFTELLPIVPDNPLPPDMERQAIKLEQAIERILRVKRSSQRNMRTGIISPRDLYRVGMKDTHVFMRKGQPMTADMAVFFLMDNSGSMSCQGAVQDGRYYSKSVLSRNAAGIIERALSKFAAIKISLFDVSGGQIRHATLKEFDIPSKGSRCYHSIRGPHQVGIGGGNKDGYSIRVAVKDLLKRKESKKVLILLCDGLPSDYNGGEAVGMDDVKAAVREARQKGVLVIPILFGPAEDRKQMADKYAYMYNKFISVEPADISSEFQRFFVRLIEKS